MPEPKVVPFSPTLRRLLNEYHAQFAARCEAAVSEFAAEQNFPPGTDADLGRQVFVVPAPDASPAGPQLVKVAGASAAAQEPKDETPAAPPLAAPEAPAEAPAPAET